MRAWPMTSSRGSGAAETPLRRCRGVRYNARLSTFRSVQIMSYRTPLGIAVVSFLIACTASQPTESPAPQPEVPAQPAAAPEPPRPRPELGAWGFDLAGADMSVKPGDDFYRYANGKWDDSNEIPPDRTSWGAFAKLDVQAEKQVKEIIESLPPNAPAGSNEQKVGDFFRSYIDTDAIERAGLAPAQPALDEIAAARNHAAGGELMGRPGL